MKTSKGHFKGLWIVLVLLALCFVTSMLLLHIKSKKITSMSHELVKLQHQVRALKTEKSILKDKVSAEESYSIEVVQENYESSPGEAHSVELPMVDLYLKITSNKSGNQLKSKLGTYIGGASLIESELYEKRGYLPNTELAYLTWYGGTGTDICIVKEDAGIYVYERNASETEGHQKDESYNFKEITRVEISDGRWSVIKGQAVGEELWNNIVNKEWRNMDVWAGESFFFYEDNNQKMCAHIIFGSGLPIVSVHESTVQFQEDKIIVEAINGLSNEDGSKITSYDFKRQGNSLFYNGREYVEADSKNTKSMIEDYYENVKLISK